MRNKIALVAILSLLPFLVLEYALPGQEQKSVKGNAVQTGNMAEILNHSNHMIEQGRQIFRYDTFGDEAFWGDTIKLHQTMQGKRFGRVGPGVSPRTALAVGLKVDVDELHDALIESLRKGWVNLDDPAITLALLKLNAVVG